MTVFHFAENFILFKNGFFFLLFNCTHHFLVSADKRKEGEDKKKKVEQLNDFKAFSNLLQAIIKDQLNYIGRAL